jgi:glycosyltransferase involved in cell wall biosynthesis
MLKLPENASFEAAASKRVSFIITTRNRAEYLKGALERLRGLRHEKDEVIIIDGLSTDGTAEVVRQHLDLVDVFVSEADFSGAHALNKGILLARGKYIKQIADDDIFYPEAMEQAVRILDEHPEVDLMVCGGTRVIGERSSPVYLPPGFNYGKSVHDVFRAGACGTGFVFRRSCFARIGLLHPTDMIADQEIVLRAIVRGAGVRFCRINLFYHRIYEHSVTVSHRVAWDQDRNNLIKRYAPPKYYHVYRLRKWYTSELIPWVLRHRVLTMLARAARYPVRLIVGRKRPAPSAPQAGESTSGGCLWDGGFS